MSLIKKVKKIQEMLRGNPIEAKAYIVWVPQTIQGMERNIYIRERVILVQHSFD